MEDRSSEKLKSPMESLEQLNLEMGPGSSAQNHKRDSSDDDGDDLWFEDRSFSDGSDNGLIKASELDREWASRHNQFYTIGYRDGLIAGKEASAQEGFNIGFKQSVRVGYNWGLVRGVTSTLACLPDDLKEKLVGKVKLSERFQNLYGSVHSISSKVALKMFHDDILSRRSEQPQNKENVDVETMQGESSECNQLGRYSRELESLLHESPSIEVHAAVDQQTVG